MRTWVAAFSTFGSDPNSLGTWWLCLTISLVPRQAPRGDLLGSFVERCSMTGGDPGKQRREGASFVPKVSMSWPSGREAFLREMKVTTRILSKREKSFLYSHSVWQVYFENSSPSPCPILSFSFYYYFPFIIIF